MADEETEREGIEREAARAQVARALDDETVRDLRPGERIRRIEEVEAPVVPPLGGPVGGPDPLSAEVDDPTLYVSRGGSVLPASAVRRERATLIGAGVLVAAALIGLVVFLLVRNRGDDSSVVASDTSLATDTSVADSSLVDTSMADTAPVADAGATAPPTTTAAGGGSVVPAAPPSSAASPSPSAAPAPSAASGASPAPSASSASSAPAASGPATTAGSAATTGATPPGDVIEMASRSGTFGPFLAMVEAAGLTGVLRTDKPTTVFVPTESAFASLPNDVQAALRAPANRDVLARIVRYHVLGQSLKAAQLTSGTYPTLEGSTLSVTSAGGTVRVNDAKVTGADVVTSNGVFHAIDKLLLPSGLDLQSLVAKANGPATSGASNPTTGATTAPTRAPSATSVTPTTSATTTVATTSAAPVTATTAPAPTTVPASSPAATTTVVPQTSTTVKS